MFSLIYAWLNGWVNNREAGDLRRHRAHYDITIMFVHFQQWDHWFHIWISKHYGDVIMDEIASQITSLTIVYSTVYSDADQRKHQSPPSLAFVREIHRGPVNSPHKWPVTRKMFPFDDVIMSPPVVKPTWLIQVVPGHKSSPADQHTIALAPAYLSIYWCILIYYSFACTIN